MFLHLLNVGALCRGAVRRGVVGGVQGREKQYADGVSTPPRAATHAFHGTGCVAPDAVCHCSRAACVTSGATNTCDVTSLNPWSQTVGTGNNAAEDNRVVAVQTGSTISVGSANAISLRDNANINVQNGATVSNNATSGLGLFGTGNNSIEFRSNGTLTMDQGGSVLPNGRQQNGEAVKR